MTPSNVTLDVAPANQSTINEESRAMTAKRTKSVSRTGRAVAVVVGAVLAAVLAFAASAQPVYAAYADDFGIADTEGAAFPGAKAFWAGACDLGAAQAEVGLAPAAPQDCIDAGVWDLNFVSLSPWAAAPSWRLEGVPQAGAHPDVTAALWLQREMGESFGLPFPVVAGSIKDSDIAQPAGFVGDPTAVSQCRSEEARQVPPQCPPETQVGIATVNISGLGNSRWRGAVYNVEPRRGETAELLMADPAGLTNIPIRAVVRSDGDFGVTALVRNVPTGFPVHSTYVTLWGVPWAQSHDRWRPRIGNPASVLPNAANNFNSGIPDTGFAPADRVTYNESWGPIRPFLNNPTECAAEAPMTTLSIASWQHADSVFDYDSPAPLVTGCGDVPFDPSATFQPTTTSADSATGLGVDLSLPQNTEPPAAVAANPSDADGAPGHWRSEAGLATAHLRKTVVTLPDGLSVNPSAAAGLDGCSDEQVGYHPADGTFTKDEPACPDGSIIGTAEVTTPLLDEHLTGEVILGVPKSTDPTSGEMFRLFLAVRNDDRGLLAKVYGSAVADPATGRLTATFDNNPRVPFDSLQLDLMGGARGVLATPQTCGQKSTAASFTPWTAGSGGSAVDVVDTFTVDDRCAPSFSPTLASGMSTQQAAGTGRFSFELSRSDGQQWFEGLTAELPVGLLAKVKGVELCRGARAASGACPVGSRIGSVDAGAGSGAPFFLERKGDVFLTEGYKGGAYGLLVKVPVEAGPFRGALSLGDIVVRQALHVDPSDASVTAVSDPFPEIWHGIPLRIRQVTVEVDRPGFMLNPTDCSAKEIKAALVSTEGATANVARPFQVSGCGALPFEPKLGLSLTGKRQVTTGAHPGVKAVVTQTGIGEAGIRKAVVRLPKSLALDPNNAQALCEFDDGTKPDLENRCPKGSIVGRARAKTPLLDRDLVGNVYFVKNVRRDPNTGNLIRTLPMIVVALRGEIAVNLRGESSTTKAGKLVNTFASVPDAPITQFNLNINGGKNGILAVTRTRKAKINLCATRQIAEADTDSHNSRRHDFDIRIKTPCTKAQVKKAKRAAKKAAAKAKS